MAYRKTEKLIAEADAWKASILAAMIDVIAKSGIDAATTAAIAQRGKFSEGVIYKYFPDKTELFAAAASQLLQRDLELLRGENLVEGLRAWARALAEKPKLTSVIAAFPAYREGIKAELLKKLRAAGAESPALSSAVVYGAVIEATRHFVRREEAPLLGALMRACGLRARVSA